MKIRIKEFRSVPKNLLDDHPLNWRIHPPEQREALAAVLGEIGIADAIKVVERDGRYLIIDGHLRKDISDADHIPVLVLDLDDDEAKKMLATFDPIGSMAESNDDQYREILESISSETDAFHQLTGQLTHHLNIRQGVPTLEDLAGPPPEPPDEPVARRGDVWILGDHRLMCGDSANAADVSVLVGGSMMHLAVFDPPYNVNVQPRTKQSFAAQVGRSRKVGDGYHRFNLHLEQKKYIKRRIAQSGSHPATKKAAPKKQVRPLDRPLVADALSHDVFQSYLKRWFQNAYAAMDPGASIYVWTGYSYLAVFITEMRNAGFYYSQCIIWNKSMPVLTRKDFMLRHEQGIYGWKKPGSHRFFGPANIPDVWDVDSVGTTNRFHLTEKPLELASRAIQYSSLKDENVLDLFGGGGWTLIACEQLHRRAHLMEIDPPYVDVIIQRWQNMTGKKAVLESTGETFDVVSKTRSRKPATDSSGSDRNGATEREN